MPWKECDKVTERMKFVARLIDGEKMAELCREFGISRVTGHKIWNRFEQDGLKAMEDKSKRPWKLANKTSDDVEQAILDVKGKYPSWGAPKINAYLSKKKVGYKIPAVSTVHAILDRHGKVKRKRKRTIYQSKGTNLSVAQSPNDLWCVDFKGQFKMGNSRYCYPLTTSDQFSRYLLSCEALEATKEKEAVMVFRKLFEEYGLPMAIRSDNGAPFATRSLFGLSRLNVLWLRLGIKLERIMPGHPEQNGRHERMHRTLKASIKKGENLLQQQEHFDDFLTVYNNERPHESLQNKCPSEIYTPSPRTYPSRIPEYDYSSYTMVKRVTGNGGLRAKSGQWVFISEVLAGEEVALELVDDRIWSITFLDNLLGYFSEESCTFNPGPNPFLRVQKV